MTFPDARTGRFSHWPWCRSRFSDRTDQPLLVHAPPRPARRWRRSPALFLRLGLEDRPQPTAQAVEHCADRLPTRHVLPNAVDLQQLPAHFLGGDPCVRQSGLKLGGRLGRRFDQLADLLDQPGRLVFGLLSPPQPEGVHTSQSGTLFPQAGLNGGSRESKFLLGDPGVAVAVLECDFRQKPPPLNSRELHCARANGFNDIPIELLLMLLVRESPPRCLFTQFTPILGTLFSSGCLSLQSNLGTRFQLWLQQATGGSNVRNQ